MPVFLTLQHISEQLHETHHRAALRQHAWHTGGNVATQWHTVSSPHLIILALIHLCHSKMTVIVSLNSRFWIREKSLSYWFAWLHICHIFSLNPFPLLLCHYPLPPSLSTPTLHICLYYTVHTLITYLSHLFPEPLPTASMPLSPPSLSTPTLHICLYYTVHTLITYLSHLFPEPLPTSPTVYTTTPSLPLHPLGLNQTWQGNINWIIHSLWQTANLRFVLTFSWKN